MGRDSSVVSKSDASETPIIRSIIDSDKVINPDENGMVHFDIKPNKIFVFNRETEERLLSGVNTKNVEEAPVAETPVEETVTTEEAPAPEVVDASKAPVEAPKKTTTKKTTTKKTVAKKTTKKSDEEK